MLKDKFSLGRSGRQTAMVLVACLGVGSAFSIAMAATSNQESDAERFVPDQGVYGSDSAPARTTDAATGQEWRVVAYASKDDGDLCLSAFPVENDQVGLYGPGGKFKPVNLSDGAGSCGDFSKGARVTSIKPFNKDGKPRIVTYGTLAPNADAARLVDADGKVTEAKLGTERTFVAVATTTDANDPKALLNVRVQQRIDGDWATFE